MTGHLTYDVNVVGLEDLRRRSERRRMAREAAGRKTAGQQRQVRLAERVTIRRANEADRVALERLAALDSAPALVGEVLMAEVGDQAVGAIEVATGVTIADPFLPTAAIVELLGVRAARLGGGTSRRRLRLRPRPACRIA